MKKQWIIMAVLLVLLLLLVFADLMIVFVKKGALVHEPIPALMQTEQEATQAPIQITNSPSPTPSLAPTATATPAVTPTPTFAVFFR